MELSDEISQITQSKLSIAEAVNQLEIVKTAFKRTEKIQSLLESHHQELESLKSQSSTFITSSYLSLKFEDFLNIVEKNLRKKFDEFSEIYCTHLESKVSNEALENQLQKKVSWAQFSAISQQVNLLQSRLDKHIYSDFEGFKTKIKLELANSVSEAKALDANNEEWVQIKNKIVVMEQKLEELFMEDDNLQDDEYDSQEEMDNMMDDIDMVAKREDSVDGEAEAEAEQSTVAELEVPIKTETSLKPESQVSEPQVEEKKIEIKEIEKPVSRHSRNRGSSVGGDSKNMQRRGSKESSVAASRALAGGGLKQVNRKLAALQKDIETNRADIDENKKYFKEIEDRIQESREYAESLERSIKNMHGTLEIMENSFIRALRRNGLDKKNKTQETVKTGLGKKDIDAIDKKIEDKFKRIIILETDMDRVHSETIQMRKFYKEKLNEIVASLKVFEDFRNKVLKDFERLEKSVRKNIESSQSNFEEINKKVKDFNIPLVDLVSDQKRENEVLSEEVRRQQEFFRVMVEEYSGLTGRSGSDGSGFIDYANKVAERYTRTARRGGTPDISVKNKFYQTAIGGSPGKFDSNYMRNLPDGKGVSLPRMPAKEKICLKGYGVSN